jgi:hypothetical protein
MMDQTEQQQIRTGATLDKLQLCVQLTCMQPQRSVLLLATGGGSSKYCFWRCSDSSS